MIRRRIILLILIGVILPSLVFISFEIASLSESEKVIGEIYNNQLSTIVFSVNQYSDDIIGSWASKINWFKSNLKYSDDTLKSFLTEKRQVKDIYFINRSVIKATKYERSNKLEQVKKFVISKQNQLQKNKNYLNANYRKNEPIGIDYSENSLFIAFWIGNDFNTNSLCVIEINAQRFVKEILAVKTQVSLENKFLIAIINKSNDSVIYFSGLGKILPKFNFQKELWLFPSYKIAVQIKEMSVEQLIKNHARKNIILLIIVELLFISGALMIFYYSRKEMQLAKLKTEFISNVSHEIRTPLALISMYVETLDMDRVSERSKVKEYYTIIMLEVQRLTTIVNNILNFSKLESGKKIFTFENISLNHVLDEVLEIYSFHFKNKGFTVFVEKYPDMPICSIDKNSLSEALVNLLDNAMKYSDTVKEITIKSGIIDHFGFIEVSDNGIGISKEDQKLIFGQFYRVTKGNLAHTAKGTGLGLSIVKYIVDAHKGIIEVDSKLGHGSTFRIKLPVQSI